MYSPCFIKNKGGETIYTRDLLFKFEEWLSGGEMHYQSIEKEPFGFASMIFESTYPLSFNISSPNIRAKQYIIYPSDLKSRKSTR